MSFLYDAHTNTSIVELLVTFSVLGLLVCCNLSKCWRDGMQQGCHAQKLFSHRKCITQTAPLTQMAACRTTKSLYTELQQSVLLTQ